ncbi:hypothetical protein HanIR_Chr08g0371321 [Helianthus annuus]|nr:hypothetical protein HanIR_Chr08g0371321 [Helianthus annuus]
MIPHTYSTDAQSQSADLAATIAAASTPEQISAVCAAVELFLNKHSPDQSRWFFSITFPTLICRLFGFDEVQTLAVTGTVSVMVGLTFWRRLMMRSSVVDVDRLSVVKYVFPIERLPEWIRLTLQNGRNCGVLSQLCPLLKGRLIEGVSCQVQLNIIEYYLFWFAYYPVSKGSCENRTVVSSRVSKRSRLESWASKSVSVLGNVRKLRGNERKTGTVVVCIFSF